MKQIRNTDKLTLKQKMFCDVYLQGACGTEAVIKAGYNVSKKNGLANRDLAKSISSENLTKPDIRRYIDIHTTEAGLENEELLKAHALLLKQDKNLPAKVKALDLAYKIKGYYRKNITKDNENIIVKITNYGDSNRAINV